MWSLNFCQVLKQINLTSLDVKDNDSLDYKSLNCNRTSSINYKKKQLYEAFKVIYER